MDYREMKSGRLAGYAGRLFAAVVRRDDITAAADLANILEELARRDAMLSAAKKMAEATTFDEFRAALAAFRVAEGGGQ